MGFAPLSAMLYWPSAVMPTLMILAFVAVFAELCGRLTFMSLGDDIVDAIMKNSNNRNIISVMDDMLNEASDLFLLFSAISVKA